MRNLSPITMLTTLTVIILSACGRAEGASTSLQLTTTDFAFTPNRLSVPAGQEITIRVSNNGAVAHDLMIMKLGKELTSHDHAGPEAHANAYWEQELLAPGTTRESTFVAPAEPGEYQIICGVAGHVEAGMVGKLVVVAAP